MTRKRGNIKDNVFLFTLILGFFLIIVLAGTQDVSSVGETSYCCEQTNTGASCVDAPITSCDPDFKSSPTSCESSVFCKLGTCIDPNEGKCLPNTPERVCNEEGGIWDERERDAIPQCQLGCCYIGDNAIYETQTRCKQLSSLYGVNTNYRTDIKSEEQCIASAVPDVKGACVFEEDFQRTCKLLTKGECLDIELNSQDRTNVEFHEGLLCSAESLATNCGRTTRTTCVEDEDEVHFLDSCGNIANIYDANKADDQNYWTEIKKKSESCNPDPESGNADSATCGNCDYLSGSTCKAYERGVDTTSPAMGDNICRDLSCEYEGAHYDHGEAWCATNPNDGSTNSPGGRHFRLVCYNGDVTVEECADYRQEVCLQSSVKGFSTADCRVNRWRDCYLQDNEKDCTNTAIRDCQWAPGDLTFLNIDEEEEQGACLPLYTPGFDTTGTLEDNSDQAEALCAIASRDCVVKFEKGLIGDYECKENCECVGLKKGDKYQNIQEENAWADQANNLCVALGDCGIQTNYLGYEGYEKDALIEVDSEEK